MSNTKEPSLIRRTFQTPLTDLFRGRLSGRWDYKVFIALTTDVPAPLRDVVLRVTRRTRLWSSERADVATELLSHFADGLAEGESVDDLLTNFGDERAAAKLIRRARIRNRPLVWHATRWAARGVGAVVGLYVLLGVYFLLGKPTVGVDYVARLNAPLANVPQEHLAWPVYRQAIMQLSKAGESGNREWPKVLGKDPRGRHWPAIVTVLRRDEKGLALARQAAAMPVLGFQLGPDGAGRDPELWPPHPMMATIKPSPPTPMTGSLIGTTLPYLGELRQTAELLALDVRLATQDRDAPRVEAGVTAIIGTARQLFGVGPSLWVNRLVGCGHYMLALDALERVLVTAPDLLSDDQLVRLAHLLATPRARNEVVTPDDRRAIFLDIVQRAYTDDGHGDGRLTTQGLWILRYALTVSGGARSSRDVFSAPLFRGAFFGTGPLTPVAASRAEVVRTYQNLVDQDELLAMGPLRGKDFLNLEKRVNAMVESPVDRVRYAFVIALAPSSAQTNVEAERMLGRRDGLVTAIALELYQRRHGRYPKSLAELVPTFLPVVPEDRVAGGLLRYKVDTAGRQPVLYSVGDDLDDDGGRPAVVRKHPDPVAAAKWGIYGDRKLHDGDWVVYPPSFFEEPLDPEDPMELQDVR